VSREERSLNTFQHPARPFPILNDLAPGYDITGSRKEEVTVMKNNMRCRQTSKYIVMASGILLLAGCSFLADEPKGGVQGDSTLENQSKSLTGSYKDMGPDGSIKPHPEPSYKMRQEPQDRTTGVIILGGPAAMPELKMGTTPMKGATGGKTPSSGSVSNSRGSSSGAYGK
jgi:hypothetical protein